MHSLPPGPLLCLNGYSCEFLENDLIPFYAKNPMRRESAGHCRFGCVWYSLPIASEKRCTLLLAQDDSSGEILGHPFAEPGHARAANPGPLSGSLRVCRAATPSPGGSGGSAEEAAAKDPPGAHAPGGMLILSALFP